LICNPSLPYTVFTELLKKANIKSSRNVSETGVLVDSKISDTTSYLVLEKGGGASWFDFCSVEFMIGLYSSGTAAGKVSSKRIYY